MTIYELLLEEYIKDLEQQIRLLESDINLRKALDDWEKNVVPTQVQPWIPPFPSASKCAVCGMELKNYFACGNAMCPQQLRFVD